jgi:hypothetical protein
VAARRQGRSERSESRPTAVALAYRRSPDVEPPWPLQEATALPDRMSVEAMDGRLFASLTDGMDALGFTGLEIGHDPDQLANLGVRR